MLYAQLETNGDKLEFIPTELFVKSSPKRIVNGHGATGHGVGKTQGIYK